MLVADKVSLGKELYARQILLRLSCCYDDIASSIRTLIIFHDYKILNAIPHLLDMVGVEIYLPSKEMPSQNILNCLKIIKYVSS